MARRRQHHPAHDYPRTARLNELIREILAEELERVGDERLDLVTVVAVEVEPDLRHATVHVAGLGDQDEDPAMMEALAELRPRLQGAIGRQARVKRVPELAFRPDEITRSAARIEAILRDIHRPPEEGPEPGDER